MNRKDGLVAYLYNSIGYTYFMIGKEVIKFATSKNLIRYVKVKEYDNGYIVVDAEYKNPRNGKSKIMEEYIDMEFIMSDLGVKTDILKEVKEVKIKQCQKQIK